MANEFPTTHFFKIICDQSLHQGKLIIPRKFVEKYGEGLSNAIYLKTPNGAKWKLNLVKSDGKIWFEKGWKEFMKYHSLSQGHLLLFKYGRTSHFHVHIFDKSALEIKYPSQRVESKRVSNDLGNKPQNDEDLEDYIASKKRKTNLSFEFNQPCEIGSNSCVNVGKLEKVAALNHIDKKCKGKQLAIAKKVTTFDRANSMRTCNPSFIAVMHPSYIDAACNLHIPSEFGKRHLLGLGKKKGDIHLRLLNGKVWPARYLIRKGNRKGVKYEMYSSEWKTFAEDNNLKVGDVCTFELFPTSTILTFIVHIFRDSFET